MNRASPHAEKRDADFESGKSLHPEIGMLYLLIAVTGACEALSSLILKA